MSIVAGMYARQERERKEEQAKYEREIQKDIDPQGYSYFMYLRACIALQKLPEGIFTGNAGISADVIRQGGNILDMYHAGCDCLYAAHLTDDLEKADAERVIKSYKKKDKY
ncbi:hypothetical protein FACS1894190_14710 [Spirochaetia bacterium]|nr:hypothetical protein FACS1894190_14710 [Spirochaetia bacterium]